MKVVVCIICLALLFFEAAFSICLGCKIYGIFKKDPVTHCPGGICEIRTKDAIQTFNLAQKVITLFVVFTLSFGLYSYFTKVESKTFLAKKVKIMMMSDAERQAFKEAKMQAEFDAF
jgi:uncharacterized membrane protein YjgN (DUF898 family)